MLKAQRLNHPRQCREGECAQNIGGGVEGERPQRRVNRKLAPPLALIAATNALVRTVLAVL